LPVMIAPFYRPQPERGSAIFSGQNGNHKSVPTATAQTFLISRRCSDCLLGAAIAQQLDRIWRIGILHGVPAEASVGVSAFRQRFGELAKQHHPMLYQSLITTNLESARRPHHLQNPQNRPWYRFCNRLADRPLGGMGESGTSRMEAEWPTPSRSRADGARRRRG
jgi:hypothetical protein